MLNKILKNRKYMIFYDNNLRIIKIRQTLSFVGYGETINLTRCIKSSGFFFFTKIESLNITHDRMFQKIKQAIWVEFQHFLMEIRCVLF